MANYGKYTAQCAGNHGAVNKGVACEQCLDKADTATFVSFCFVVAPVCDAPPGRAGGIMAVNDLLKLKPLPRVEVTGCKFL